MRLVYVILFLFAPLVFITTANALSSSITTPPSNYWNTEPIYISAEANNASSVILYYRHSEDNVTWSGWKDFATDTNGTDGWGWYFTFPDGPGHYKFTTVAVNDSKSESELANQY